MPFDELNFDCNTQAKENPTCIDFKAKYLIGIVAPWCQVAALVVEEFRADETGVYRCRVDFRAAQTRNTFFNVSLIGEPRFISWAVDFL